jgi:hypothetical protein
MPLWISVALVFALWLSSWIVGLDTNGDLADAYVLWGATGIATVFLLLRLLRVAGARRG